MARIVPVLLFVFMVVAAPAYGWQRSSYESVQVNCELSNGVHRVYSAWRSTTENEGYTRPVETTGYCVSEYSCDEFFCWASNSICGPVTSFSAHDDSAEVIADQLVIAYTATSRNGTSRSTSGDRTPEGLETTRRNRTVYDHGMAEVTMATETLVCSANQNASEHSCRGFCCNCGKG